MPRHPMKAFGWTAFREGKQVRCVIWARSKTQVLEIAKGAGCATTSAYLSETGNAKEREVAMLGARGSGIMWMPLSTKPENGPWLPWDEA